MRVAFSCGLLAIAFSLSAQNSPPGPASVRGSFDTPIKKEIVDFGPSPYYRNPKTAPRVKLSCFYFPTFVIKEYDEGEKGAEWLAIVPVTKEEVPDCSRSHELGAKVIRGREWGGYFKGVKNSLVFFDAVDGTDGGLPFGIYDATTGTRVFEDSAYDADMGNRQVKDKDDPFNRLRTTGLEGGPVTISYLRVVEAGCDLNLHSERAACWDKVKASLHLLSARAPVCSGYESISDKYDSAIAYPVDVTLSQHPRVKNVTGPTKCWPVD